MARQTSYPEGRDFTVNIYRDLAMCSSRNNNMRPYTEMIVGWLDSYASCFMNEDELFENFSRLSQSPNAELPAKHFAQRACQYISNDRQHAYMMSLELPF